MQGYIDLSHSLQICQEIAEIETRCSKGNGLIKILSPELCKKILLNESNEVLLTKASDRDMVRNV